jgi:hypothetical protein
MYCPWANSAVFARCKSGQAYSSSSKETPMPFVDSSIPAHNFSSLRGTRSSMRSWSRLPYPAPLLRDLQYVLDHGN